jgi:hypothetical protein
LGFYNLALLFFSKNRRAKLPDNYIKNKSIREQNLQTYNQ